MSLERPVCFIRLSQILVEHVNTIVEAGLRSIITALVLSFETRAMLNYAHATRKDTVSKSLC